MGFMHFALLLLCNVSQRKHLFRWLRSLRKNYFLKMGQPWLVFDAIDYLSSMPLKDKRVFEYGSGGSTLFWLNNGAECVSVEHNPDWYILMRPLLTGRVGVDYRLQQPEPVNDPGVRDCADPNLYLSDDASFHGYHFKKYASQIDVFPDNSFDIVLIDGRARPSCIMHSVMKVKVGGVMILDNSDRKYYFDKVLPLLRNFDRVTFKGVTPGDFVFAETTVFMRSI